MTQSTNRSMFWRLWLRSISVKRPQAALAIGSLLVGAALTSTLLNLYGDVRRKMNQEFRAYGPNVVVAPAPIRSESASETSESAGASSDSRSFSGVLDENVTRRLEAFRAEAPGLVAVPVLYVTTRVKHGASDLRLPEVQNAVVVGADFAALQRLFSGWRVEGARGADKALGQGMYVVGVRLAARLGLGLGDTVEIDASGQNSRQDDLGRQTFRIESLLSTGASEDDQVFIPLSSLQRLAGLEGKVSVLQLSVPGETQAIERTVGSLSRSFPDLEVRPIRQIVYSEGRVLETIRWLLFLLTALILVIMGLCVTATMTAIVLERRKDVAVMKALGASDSLVMQLFLTEGATLGLTGGVAGFILGALLAHLLAQRLFGVALNLVWWSLPVVCLAMMLVALAATVFPVGIVRGVEPARVLKGE